MNKVILIGRLTKDPEVRHIGDGIMVATYSLAVERQVKRDDVTADFIRCVCFGKGAEFCEKYLHKGMKIGVCGRIQTGSYIDKDKVKRFTVDVVVESHEFCQKKDGADGEYEN